MADIKRVVTHPGGAHKDDLLACSVLIAVHGCPVVRRDPTPEELADPAVAIVDVGGSHDAALANFDHHQFPREHPPTCALSLVLDGMGLYGDALQFCDWLETAEYFDSRGPNRTAEWLGVPREAIAKLNSPIDITLLRRFAAQGEHRPGEVLYEFMRFVGADLVEFLRSVRAAIDEIDRTVERWSIGTATGDTIETLFLARNEDASIGEPSASLGRYIRAKGLESDIGAIAYPDRRGSGYGLGRYEDDPRLDFSGLEAEPDVHFAHKSGFMCKTSATAPERLKELVGMAAR